LDKSNPLIELLTDPQYPDEILVFFGTRLLEKVDRSKDSVETKLLAGRLYNAGFQRKSLVREFGWDLKTIQSYGDALKSGCSKTLSQALSGQGATPKLDEDKQHFVRQLFRQHGTEQGCHINRYIRNELECQLKTKVSREPIRLLIKDEKAKMQREAEAIPVVSDDASEVPITANGGEDSCHYSGNSASGMQKNCNLSPSFTVMEHGESTALQLPESVLLHHGGLLLVRALIDRVFDSEIPLRDLLRQWLGAVLCGCANIEQMGCLNYPSLEIIIGPQFNSLSTQREYLLKHSNAELIAALRKRNLQFLRIRSSQLFFYDPHGIEYTGQLSVLKGWLGGSHSIGKAYYQDFIHTLDGKPMVAFLDDNRSTLLKRLPVNVQELRHLLDRPHDAPITLIVDRAIYSLPDLQHYRDKLNIRIVTWEKNHTRPPWAPASPDIVNNIHIPKAGNNSKDITIYKIEYYTQPWTRDASV
ncbi:hypothetical protein BVY04_00755, partial [bacterium M21]